MKSEVGASKRCAPSTKYSDARVGASDIDNLTPAEIVRTWS
jgi:hypothetical protein